jgi:hypothetical protein
VIASYYSEYWADDVLATLKRAGFLVIERELVEEAAGLLGAYGNTTEPGDECTALAARLRERLGDSGSKA